MCCTKVLMCHVKIGPFPSKLTELFALLTFESNFERQDEL